MPSSNSLDDGPRKVKCHSKMLSSSGLAVNSTSSAENSLASLRIRFTAEDFLLLMIDFVQFDHLYSNLIQMRYSLRGSGGHVITRYRCEGTLGSDVEVRAAKLIRVQKGVGVSESDPCRDRVGNPSTQWKTM